MVNTREKIERLLALETIIATRFRLGEIARSRATEKYLKVTLPLGNVDGPLDERMAEQREYVEKFAWTRRIRKDRSSRVTVLRRGLIEHWNTR